MIQTSILILNKNTEILSVCGNPVLNKQPEAGFFNHFTSFNNKLASSKHELKSKHYKWGNYENYQIWSIKHEQLDKDWVGKAKF